ncbi:nickel pincer cofactor biosynthesis protein LarC [Haladaptatus sp. GCM10025707]|uniref:nickel pincer cofactor biosynthesis protein LarC n=1 Tax=unclassified Haladaptatus TaxID=2622732 RepID=UPI0023E7BD79|nr:MULTISPECIES: nickel pincer cofactor biosynthesis protein LarC [unclassified Haladaptatus]
MRTVAFDGRMGASGDMLLGALLAAGASPDALAPVEAALDIRYDVRTVDKNGISATKVDVLLTDQPEAARRTHEDAEGYDYDEDDETEHEHSHEDGHDHSHEHGHAHDHEHDHGHEHGHTHSHDHAHDHSHGHTHAEGAGPHRTYAEVIEIVERMELPTAVEQDAKAVFKILGEAEATVHDTDLDDTHFHEVGADDAIADVVGACLLFADIAPEQVVTTPLSVGGGEADMAHGRYPIPTPAVVEIAAQADWELQGGPVEAELLTPTGAAILAHFATGVDSLPALKLEQSGYGAGGWSFPDRPNVLRAMVGAARGGLVQESITVLETNVDDVSPEILGGLQDALSERGALDVSIIPMTMKKARPGHLVKVVVRAEDADRVARKLAEETGTLGVREMVVRHRWTAKRHFETVTLDIDGETYDVSVKLATDTDDVRYDVSAEYEDAAAVAEATGLPIREIMRRAENAVDDA